MTALNSCILPTAGIRAADHAERISRTRWLDVLFDFFALPTIQKSANVALPIQFSARTCTNEIARDLDSLPSSSIPKTCTVLPQTVGICVRRQLT